MLLAKQTFTISLLSLILISCKSKNPQDLIVGKWQTLSLEKSGENDTTVLTFNKDKTATLIVHSAADTISNFKGTYELTAKKELLITKPDGGIEKALVVELTDNKLKIASPSDTLIWSRIE